MKNNGGKENFCNYFKEKIKKVRHPLVVEVISNGKDCEEVKTNFMGPNANVIKK